jgi:Ca-activated chloride channel family protein
MSTLALVWPYSNLLLLMLPLLWWVRKKKRQSVSALKAPMALYVKSLAQNKPTFRLVAYDFWLALMWALLVLAASRPQLVGKPIYIPQEGRAIMLAIDISESMEIPDMELENKPASRIAIAKDVLNSFIDKRPTDRIGLVVFGTEAFLHAPLSFDHHLIKRFLNEAQIGMAGPKTAIGDAIGLATKKLIEQVEGERVIILLTDGQNNEGSLTPMDAANIAKKNNIKLYIAGLGSSRMVVDGFFGPQVINPSLSLDQAEPELKKMASITNGIYFRAKDLENLKAIYSKIDAMEPIKAEPKTIIPHKEIFYWPLMAFLLIFYLRFIWTQRKGYAVV